MDVNRFRELPIMGILRGVNETMISPLVEAVVSAGLKTVENIDEIEAGTVIIRSHGAAPEEVAHLRDKGLRIVDATCILVKRVQQIAVELEKEGFTVIPTAMATRLTMNREGIRRLAAEKLGLMTSPYSFAETWEEFLAAIREISIPCVVKPIMSSSGKGQSREEKTIGGPGVAQENLFPP